MIAFAGHDTKLVVVNKNTRIASSNHITSSPQREPYTLMKMADEGSSSQSFSWPLLNGKKTK